MINDKPLVSVLMTVYNREKFIEDAIRSVLASTYKNFEFIIVDDRSSDDSVQIAKRYEKTDDRIKVFQNETNLGDYPNRNRAASYAKGKYLKYVDADDLIYPHGLEQLVYYMENFPEAGFGLCSIDQDNDHIFPFQLSPREIYIREHIKKITLLHVGPTFSIIKKSVFDAAGGFRKVRHFGDTELWHRLGKKYPLVCLPQGIIWYRRTEGQEGSLRIKNPSIGLKELQLQLAHISESSLKESEKIIAIKNVQNKICQSIISSAKRHSLKKSFELKKEATTSYFELLRFLFSKKKLLKK